MVFKTLKKQVKVIGYIEDLKWKQFFFCFVTYMLTACLFSDKFWLDLCHLTGECWGFFSAETEWKVASSGRLNFWGLVWVFYYIISVHYNVWCTVGAQWISVEWTEDKCLCLWLDCRASFMASSEESSTLGTLWAAQHSICRMLNAH